MQIQKTTGDKMKKEIGATSVSFLVSELERQTTKQQKEIAEIRGTLLVNFGEEGRHTKGIVNQRDTTIQMVVKTLRHFVFMEEK